MYIGELTARLIAICESEAIALNLPKEAGRDIFHGIMEDDTEDWSKEKFLTWSHQMDFRYGYLGVANSPVFELYKVCCQRLNQYAQGSKGQIIDEHGQKVF